MNIFLDFDDTLTDSIENVVRIANKRYNKTANHKELSRWDFSDLYPDIKHEELTAIFGEKEFFDTLKLKNDVIKSLTGLCRSNNIIIVSKVTLKAMKPKALWIKNNLSDIGIKVQFIGVLLDKSKGVVDMADGIVVDDNVKFLEETNAKYKIYFNNQRKFDETQQWGGLTVYNWKELYKLLKDIIKKEKELKYGKI